MDWETFIRPAGRSGDAIRLGALENAYARPLLFGLDRYPDIALDTLSAETLATRFSSGNYACGLLPVLDALAYRNGRLIPGLGVCAPGGASRDWLVCRVAPQEVRTLAAGPGGQAALARLIVAERFGALPEEAPLDCADAVAVSGDAAFISGTHSVDLAVLWHEMTGLPLVLAVWVTGFRAPVARLRAVLARAAQEGEHLHVDPLTYRLGGNAMEAVRVLLRLGVLHGLCPADATLRMC